MKKWRVLAILALLMSFTAPSFAMPASPVPTARSHRHRKHRRHGKRAAARHNRLRRIN